MREKNQETERSLKAIVLKCLIAFWTVGIAFLMTLLLSPLMQPGVSPLFLLAVMISAWRGGLLVGLLATFLAAFASAFVLLPPKYSLEIDHNDWLQIIVFTFAAVVIGSLSASRKRAEEDKELLLIKTEKARVEAEQANAVKDEFLAAVSHELRTPLTTIKTLTRVMQRRELAKEEQTEYLKDIASECDRQIDLVHNLLDLSKIKSGGLDLDLRCVNIEEVIRACEKIERIEANEHNHKISVEIAPDLPFVKADHSALRRALCTIIENAIKFTPRGGKIVLRSYNQNDEVIIEVEDTGRGISEDDLPHIFDKFYRGRQIVKNSGSEPLSAEVPGVGLGLNLAKVLIESMKGKVSVKSQLGRGSNFMIHLPEWKESSGQNLSRDFSGLILGDASMSKTEGLG